MATQCSCRMRSSEGCISEDFSGECKKEKKNLKSDSVPFLLYINNCACTAFFFFFKPCM